MSTRTPVPGGTQARQARHQAAVEVRAAIRTQVSTSKDCSAFNADAPSGGGAYSSQPQTTAAKPKGILPVKAFLHFKQINVAAAKGKIAQLNDELKNSDVSLGWHRRRSRV